MLLGIWCAIGTAPLKRRLGLSLAGTLCLSVEPVGQMLINLGFRIPAMDFREWAVLFGIMLFVFSVHFAVAAGAVVFAKTVWPRWRLAAVGADLQQPAISQFSMKQLLLGVTACTPLLLASRLVHDHVNLESLDRPTRILAILVESPLAAVIALLSLWAALGRTHTILRCTGALLTIPLAVWLACFAARVAPSDMVVRFCLAETKFTLAFVTLSVCRRNGYRIETVPGDAYPSEPPTVASTSSGR